MISSLLSITREGWATLRETLYFLPAFPEQIDTLALLSLVLICGLLVAEWLRVCWGWPRVLGYVIAGTVFGPPLFGWIDADIVSQLHPFSDAALGLLLLEAGRRLDLRWLLRNRALLSGSICDIVLSFMAVYWFAYLVAGLDPVWAAATAAVTMASAPEVALLITEESHSQGQVTERVMMYSALGSAASFVVFVVVLGLVHAQHGPTWVTTLVHPLWAGGGACLIGWLASRLTLLVAGQLRKRSLAQVFVLVATALFTVGVSRMLGVPVFLTLFLMGIFLAAQDSTRVLSYTSLPEGHWLLAILLFVVVGASLPWRDASWLMAAQALGLLLARALAKLLAMTLADRGQPIRQRLLTGIGLQPMSATALFMILEIIRLYPESGSTPLQLAFFTAAIMNFVGPALCRYALGGAGETPNVQASNRGTP